MDLGHAALATVIFAPAPSKAVSAMMVGQVNTCDVYSDNSS